MDLSEGAGTNIDFSTANISFPIVEHSMNGELNNETLWSEGI